MSSDSDIKFEHCVICVSDSKQIRNTTLSTPLRLGWWCDESSQKSEAALAKVGSRLGRLMVTAILIHTHALFTHMPRLTLLLMRISLQLAPTSELSYLRPKKSCFPAKPAVWQNHTNHRTKINKVSQNFIRSCIDHAMRS